MWAHGLNELGRENEDKKESLSKFMKRDELVSDDNFYINSFFIDFDWMLNQCLLVEIFCLFIR